MSLADDCWHAPQVYDEGSAGTASPPVTPRTGSSSAAPAVPVVPRSPYAQHPDQQQPPPRQQPPQQQQQAGGRGRPTAVPSPVDAAPPPGRQPHQPLRPVQPPSPQRAAVLPSGPTQAAGAGRVQQSAPMERKPSGSASESDEDDLLAQAVADMEEKELSASGR